MVEDIPHKLLDVRVRESVVHVPSVAPALHEILAQEDPQSL